MLIDQDYINLKVKYLTLIKLKALKWVEGQLEHNDDNRSTNNSQSDGDTQDEDILIGDEDIVPDDGEDPLGFTPSFSKDKVTHPILWV